MKLESTPHIRLRRANGLINIDYTACDIIGLDQDSGKAAARSYNTIIGVYTRSSNGKIYLENSCSYSQTTAGKHKPRAAALAIHNGYKVISWIKPEVLKEVFFTNINVDEIVKEAETRKLLLKELHDNEYNGKLLKHLKVTGAIKAQKAPESTTYKNGNQLTKYYYSTNFKYVSNITYELNNKAVKVTVKTRNGQAVTNKYKNPIVNIRE